MTLPNFLFPAEFLVPGRYRLFFSRLVTRRGRPGFGKFLVPVSLPYRREQENDFLGIWLGQVIVRMGESPKRAYGFFLFPPYRLGTGNKYFPGGVE